MNIEDRTSELNRIRMQSLIDTLSAQRNDALNQCANLVADKTLLSNALQESVVSIKTLSEQNSALMQQVTDLNAALQEAHDALRNSEKSDS